METKLIPGPPHFNSEREEADWWFNNQDYILQEFLRAKAEGRLGHGTLAKRLAEKQAAVRTTIRIDDADLTLARNQAEEKGLRYQTYLKMLIHEQLIKQEVKRTRASQSEKSAKPKKRKVA